VVFSLEASVSWQLYQRQEGLLMFDQEEQKLQQKGLEREKVIEKKR